MAGSPLKNLQMFKQLCGKNALPNIILTTTMWDDVEPELGARRELDLVNTSWKDMIRFGSKTLRFTNTHDSAWNIIDDALSPIHKARALRLQKELVDMEQDLPETSAGRELCSELEKLMKKQQETLQKIRDEMRRNDRRPIVLQSLKTDYDNQQSQLTKTMKELNQLQVPLGARLRRFLNTTSSVFTSRR
jgi:hypothetical protein